MTSPMRVSTLPRMSLNVEAEPERGELGDAARRAGADDGARRGSSPRVQAVAGDRARRAGPRATGMAATTRPGSGAVGRSLSECTARSTSPASRARRSAAAKTPVPPIVASEAVEVSPSVMISTSSTAWPRARSRSATQVDWVVARALRRVPRRRVERVQRQVRSRHTSPLRRRHRRGGGLAGTQVEQLAQGLRRSRRPGRPRPAPSPGRSGCAAASRRCGARRAGPRRG